MVVEWLLRINGVSEVIVKIVRSLYKGTTTKVRAGFVVFKEFSQGWYSSSLCITTAFVGNSGGSDGARCKKGCVT